MTEAYVRPQKISKTELLVTVFFLKKKELLTNFTKSFTPDSTDILDKPPPVRSQSVEINHMPAGTIKHNK